MFRKIAVNTGISFSARILGAILGFFSLAIMARILGQEGFGLYSTALAWAYLFSFVADLGLYNLLAREIGRSEKKQEEQIVSHIVTLRLVSLIISLAIGIFILFVSPWKFGISVTAVGLASIMYAFLSLTQVLMGVFQKHLRLEGPAFAELVGRFFTFALVALLFYMYGKGVDYQVILIIPALSAIIGFILNVKGARSLVAFRLQVDVASWKGILAKTLPIGLSIVLTALYFKMDTLFIAFFRGQEEVGLYNVAYRIFENLLFFPAAFVGILFPQLSKFALTNKERFSSIFQGIYDVLLLTTFPLALGIFFEAEAIVRLIGGGEFVGAAPVLQILGIAIIMIYFGTLFSQGLIALNQQKILAIIYGVGAAVNIGANFFVVPVFGFIGAGVTTLWTEALVLALMIWVIAQHVTLHIYARRFIPVVLAAVSMSLALYIVEVNLFLSVLMGFLVYGSVLIISGGITKEDLELIKE